MWGIVGLLLQRRKSEINYDSRWEQKRSERMARAVVQWARERTLLTDKELSPQSVRVDPAIVSNKVRGKHRVATFAAATVHS